MKKLTWYDLGKIPYKQAWLLQKSLRKQRIEKQITDTLLLLEHPPTITLGRLRGEKSLRHSIESLKQKSVEVIRSDRGGDATLHAPGQIVGYLIIDIQEKQLKLPDFVEKIAGALLQTLQKYNVKARYDKDHPGVWVGEQKIAAFGFHLEQGVTMHGLAMNLQTDLSLFDLIIPCGLKGKGVASLAQFVQQAPSPQEFAPQLAQNIAISIGNTCIKGDAGALNSLL